MILNLCGSSTRRVLKSHSLLVYDNVICIVMYVERKKKREYFMPDWEIYS